MKYVYYQLRFRLKLQKKGKFRTAMSSDTVKIDQFLNAILSRKEFDNFTIMELRDAYAKESGDESDLNQTRKLVYRLLMRLLKLNLFVKEVSCNSRKSRYKKTDKFLRTSFTSKLRRSHLADSKEQAKFNQKNIKRIEERLKQYQVELLSSIGESEEYKRLYSTNPELKTILEKQYHLARDNSSRLLGQIKALKQVMSHFSG